jgi:hypothetical protein
MKLFLIATISILVTQANAVANEIVNVELELKHSIIDNSIPNRASASFKTVCKIKDTIEFKDVRSNEVQNFIPKKLSSSCKIKYLDKVETLKIHAGIGVYLDENQDSKYALTGNIVIGGHSTTAWGSSDTELNEVFNLAIDTSQRVSPKNPKRNEGLRVFYKFYK